MGYDYVDVDSLEGEGPGGMVRKVRRAVGARAFGFNHFTIPPGVEGLEFVTFGAPLDGKYEPPSWG